MKETTNGIARFVVSLSFVVSFNSSNSFIQFVDAFRRRHFAEHSLDFGVTRGQWSSRSKLSDILDTLRASGWSFIFTGPQDRPLGQQSRKEESVVFEPKIKIERALYERLKQISEQAGYSSVEEFVQHVLEKTAADLETAQSEAEVRERMKGLGYIE